jgi:hypothetical protein
MSEYHKTKADNKVYSRLRRDCARLLASTACRSGLDFLPLAAESWKCGEFSEARLMVIPRRLLWAAPPVGRLGLALEYVTKKRMADLRCGTRQ